MTEAGGNDSFLSSNFFFANNIPLDHPKTYYVCAAYKDGAHGGAVG